MITVPNKLTSNFKQLCLERAVARTHNSTYPKVAVQLNQALCIYQSLFIFDTETLLNRHLWVAANRYRQV